MSRTAFFRAGGPDVRGETDVDLSSYSVLVCNSSLDPAKVRTVAPNATLLAYVIPRAVPLSGPNNTVKQSLRAAMGLGIGATGRPYVLDDDARESWYFYGVDGHLVTDPSYPKLVMLRPVLDAAEAYAQWINAHLIPGWDGLYLDDFWEILPERYAIPWHDSMDAPGIRWRYWRDYFSDLLCSFTGKPLVGNIGKTQHNFPKHLDGICLENRHGSVAELATAFVEARKLPRPDLNTWWSPDESVAISDDLAMRGTVRRQEE